MAISGSATGREPHCNNGCQSSFSADLGGEFQSKICGATGATFHVALSGSSSVSSQQCLECDEQSCEEFCADGACVTEDASGSASVRIFKFYGYKWENSTSYYGAKVKCGATVSGSVEGSIGGQLKTDKGYTCGECEECTRVNISGNVGVGGRGDCYVKPTASASAGSR